MTSLPNSQTQLPSSQSTSFSLQSVLISGASFAIVVWGLIEAHAFLVPLAFASLLAFLMMPLIRFMSQRRWPEWLIVIVASFVLIAPLVLTASLLVTEGHALIRDWPHLQDLALQNFNQFLDSSWAQSFGLRARFDAGDISDQFSEQAGAGMKWAFMSITKVFAAGSHLVLVLFFAIVMIASRKHMRWSMERLLAGGSGERGLQTLDAATDILEKFLAARILIIAFVFLADFIILKSFGVHYSTVLSLVLALMTLVPVLGFFVGAAPVLLVGFAQGLSPLHLLLVFLSVGTISSLQDHILAPKLIGRKLNLNFLMTYVAIFAGERMWGISGMFLGVPVLGVIRILLNSSRYRLWGNFLQQEDDNDDEGPAVGADGTAL